MFARHRLVFATLALVFLVPRPAAASFHIMQIEQVIGGVDGHTDVQAIQLRLRSSFQNQVQNGRLVAHDATGANPVVLIAFSHSVTNSASGAHVLAATSGFATSTTPAVTPDFILTNPIPVSYLAAGSITFEDNFNTIYWRVSWGGASYTGLGTGSTTNDADGQFNPDVSIALPSTTEQALQFKFAASASSTNNANDYALTSGQATFVNNGGQSGTVHTLADVPRNPLHGLLALSIPRPNPVRGSMAYSVVLPRDANVRVRILDLGGRVVRTLMDRRLAAGAHDFAWNATDRAHDARALSNGMYFLELNAEGSRRSQRFVVLQ